MSNLDQAERAVTLMESDEYNKFLAWFETYDGEYWDRQIERDVAAGKLDAMAAEALADYHAGKATPL